MIAHKIGLFMITWLLTKALSEKTFPNAKNEYHGSVVALLMAIAVILL